MLGTFNRLGLVGVGNSSSPWWMAAGIMPTVVYAPKGATDLASSYVNLVNPGANNAAPGTAPTWDTVNGWTFTAASTQYLTTSIVPGTAWTMICRFSNSSAANSFLMGARVDSVTDQFVLSPNAGVNHRYGYGNLQNNTGGNLTSGVMTLAGGICYLNGTADGNVSAGTFTTAIRPLVVGATNNNNGVISAFITGNIQAIWIANSQISAANAATLSNVMAAL